MARVKICGITTAEGLAAAVADGADCVGFNFFAASPRFVSPAQAAALTAALAGLDRPPLCVGLFVDPDDADIAATLAAVRLDVLQVYVPAPRAAEIRARFGVPVWRAVGVAVAGDLPTDCAGVDGLVVEAKQPPGATRPGGNAASFDWSILAGWAAPCPWYLAGGLTPDNVAAAIRATGAVAVDVASGVERQKGVKDPALVRAFIRAARSA